MSKVLIISGHPSLGQSSANSVVLEEVKKLLPEVEISQLDALYPDFNINVEAEQAKLTAADVIVWQFPVHWFSIPALLKKWLDDVFTYGFAYGSTGDKLHGKKLILSATVGSAAENYVDSETSNSIQQLFKPLFQSASFSGMVNAEPVVSYGMLYLPGMFPEEALTAVQEKAKAHAQRLVEAIG